jgi:LuxR family maltose regulon positive regulatory protein
MLERAFDLLAMTVLPDSQVTAWLALARLQSARGDVPGALAALQSAEALFATVHGRVVVHKARIWLLLAGQDAQIAAAAAHWAASLRLNAQSSDMEEVEQILLARWLVFNPTTRHPSQDNLLPFLEQKLAAALRRGQGGPAFELRALLALAYDNSGRSDRALDELESLLTIAEPEGYTRLFVEAGPRMQRLLQNSIARAIVPAACARLLAAFGADTVAPQPAANPQPGSQPAGALAEPLTAREGEVLALLAEGLTNRQIAARLHLSPNTVRIHTTHIYGKLGVTSRTQAAARARDLGLVLVHP